MLWIFNNFTPTLFYLYTFTCLQINLICKYLDNYQFKDDIHLPQIIQESKLGIVHDHVRAVCHVVIYAKIIKYAKYIIDIIMYFTVHNTTF